MATWDLMAGPILALLLGYGLGAVPFGYVLTRAAGLGDVRAIGSGNIGATNVLRTGNKGLAAATLLLDALKGAAAVLLARLLWPGEDQLHALAGLAAFLGHLFPVWLGFRGGKGVATMVGTVAALFWPAGLASAMVWLAAIFATRISSLAGMVCALAAPVAAAMLGRFDLVPLFLGFLFLILFKHRANIGRLVAGTEPRVGGSKG